ncbi:hypothetical protein [Uliginosibacterium sediminicola]|uniref:Uncharacterized protein n=1 Tax=Uliginosibacterium sediminicola TaxID=2024550 RepID=A0ABU9YWF5_9RHOO
MLSNVPTAVAKMARNVVIHHPNSYNIQVYRKTVTRPQSNEGTLADGVRMLNTDDEDEFDYEWIGNGYALPADTFSPASVADHGDAVIGAQPTEMRFLIEPEEEAEHPEFFTPRRTDVFYILLGDPETGAKLAFEVVDVEAMSSIPPYAPRYVCNRRDDLHRAATA